MRSQSYKSVQMSLCVPRAKEMGEKTAAWLPASGSGFSCYFNIRLFIREVIKTSYTHGHVGGICKVTRSLNFRSQQLKLNLKHLLFKFGLAQLFEWMIKIKLSS